MHNPDLSLVITKAPANSTSKALLAKLHELGVSFEVLFVADQRPVDVAEEIFIGQMRPGFGGALRDGLAKARGAHIITLNSMDDAAAADLEALWLNRSQADIVSAAPAKLLSANRSFLSSMLNLPIKSLGSPARIYNRRAMMSTKSRSEDASILPELLVQAYADGFSVAEIPSERAESIETFPLKTVYRLWVLRNSVESADYDERAHNSKIPLQRYWQRRRHNIITGWLNSLDTRADAPELQILDIGCGSSHIIQGLKRAVAFDYAFRKLRYLKKSNKHRVWGSTFALPFSEKSFNQIIHSQVIEHIPYEPAIFLELNRVLKLGGRLIIGTPDYGRIWWPIIEFFYGKILPNAYADEHITHYTRQVLIDILAEFGFRTEDYEYICGGELIIKAEKVIDSPPGAGLRAPAPRKRSPLV